MRAFTRVLPYGDPPSFIPRRRRKIVGEELSPPTRIGRTAATLRDARASPADVRPRVGGHPRGFDRQARSACAITGKRATPRRSRGAKTRVGSPPSLAPLPRVLGARALTLTMVNMTVGAGIFGLPAFAARDLGAAALFHAYLVCTILVALVGLCTSPKRGAGSPTRGGSMAMPPRRSGRSSDR